MINQRRQIVTLNKLKKATRNDNIRAGLATKKLIGTFRKTPNLPGPNFQFSDLMSENIKVPVSFILEKFVKSSQKLIVQLKFYDFLQQQSVKEVSHCRI